MKKNFIKLSLVLTVFMMVLSLTTGNVFATNSSQDGLVVNTTTDKETYKKGEKATTTISVTNTNNYDMEDITISVTLPEELSITETNFEIPILKTNETKEYKVVVENNDSKVIVKPSDTNKSDNISEQKSPSTGDKISSDLILGLIALVGISGLAIIILKKNSRLKKLMIFALISTMVLSGISIKEVYAENSTMIEKKISLVQPIIYENKDYNMNIDVIYHISNGEVITKGEVTREEWITTLVDLFDYTYVTNITTYSFSDYQEAKDPFKIETAIQYSIIDIKENEEFKPNEYATREFVAYTTIQALNLFNTSKGSLDCIDKNTLKYPDEDYLMVKFDMLKLIDNQFKPNQYVSSDEIKQVIDGINKINDLASVDESNKNHVDYQDNVKVINASYERISENTILLDNNKNIQNGEFVVINDNNFNNIAIKVEKIEKQGDKILIQYSNPLISEILKSIHLEGTTDYSGAVFVPEEGVTIGNSTSKSRKVPHEFIPLDKEFPINETFGDINLNMTLCLEEIEYCFDIDWIDSGNAIPYVNEAYCAINTNTDLNISYTGEENLIEREEPKDIIDKLGRIYQPLGPSGFIIAFDVNFVATIGGKIELKTNLDNTMGFQCIDNEMKLISENKPTLDTNENNSNISAQAKFGIKPELALTYIALPFVDIASANAECGVKVEGSVMNQLVEPYQYCLDGKTYLYASAGAYMFPDISAISDYLKVEKDFFDSSNSPLKLQIHFEETGIVDKCTRGLGDYQGIVKDSKTNSPIANATVQVFKDDKLIETLKTDSNGRFVGESLYYGDYIIKVQADNYTNAEQLFTIISNQMTELEILLNPGNQNEIALNVGKSYRIECIEDKKLYTTYKEDSIAELYYDNNNETGSKLESKGIKDTFAYRPMKKGDFIDIKLNSGIANIFCIKNDTDDINVNGERDNFSKYFRIIELNHDPLKKFELSQGSTISLDYQYIGNRFTGVRYYFSGNNLSGSRKETDYYWNSRFGMEIKEEEKILNSTENYWTSLDEGCIHKYTINSGNAILYMWYEDAQKLEIN